MPDGIPPAGPPTGAPPVAPGPTAPAAVPANNQGMKMRGMVMATPVMKGMLEMIKLLGPESEEGRVVLECLSKMSKKFGSAGGDLTRQEGKLLMERAAPVAPGGGGGPGAPNPMAMRQAAAARQGAMGMSPQMQPAA